MKIVWLITLLAVTATAVTALTGCPAVWIALCAFVSVVSVLLLWIVVLKPVRKAATGIELLKGEEYNNRLTPSAEPGANRIVKVFNSLMDKLSDERTRLIETNNLLNLLVEVSPMGVAIMDFDYRFTMVNEAFRVMTDTEDKDIIGKCPEEAGGAVLRSVAQLSDGEEIIVKCADTEIYRVSRLSFVENGFKRPFILIEKLTDEIRKAEKNAYGRVIRTIAHEVNNTIGGLRSFMESLIETECAEGMLRELAVSCMEGCGHLTEFIRGYAEVVRLGEPVFQQTDYNEAIRAELPFLKSILSQEVTVVTDLCEPSPVIQMDRAMMRQTLINIVKNAGESIMETGRKDGMIRITTRAGSEGWSIEIEDNGKGISDDEAAMIFNPFHTTKRNGQGLGLTLTAEILRRHGFRFSLLTVEPGRTVFRISS